RSRKYKSRSSSFGVSGRTDPSSRTTRYPARSTWNGPKRYDTGMVRVDCTVEGSAGWPAVGRRRRAARSRRLPIGVSQQLPPRWADKPIMSTQEHGSGTSVAATVERRRAPRLQVLGRIQGELKPLDIPIRVLNISHGGFMVQAAVSFPVGE